MTKERKSEIKKYLWDYVPLLDELRVHDEIAQSYRELDRFSPLDENQTKEYIKVLERHLEIKMITNKLRVGIDNLDRKEHEVDKNIFECIYLYGYSVTKTGYIVGYTDKGVEKRLDIIYKKLNKYIEGYVEHSVIRTLK